MGRSTGSKAEERTTVVVVDDHEMILQSLMRLLGDEVDLAVIGSARTAAEAVEVARARRPDVVVMDYHLPDGNGATAARSIREELPTTAVILLSGSVDPATVLAAVGGACAGCIEKTRAFGELVDAVRAVHRGLRVMPPEHLELVPSLEELELRYQPIVELEGYVITGFEELLRWRSPTRGLLAPGSFLELLQETDLMVDIGHWVVQEASSACAGWQRPGGAGPVSVSVNLSAKELCSKALPMLIRDVLAATHVDPHLLVLEATERDLLTDSRETKESLERLRHLGVRLSLDDFGTGFSSLGYLRQFAVDIIKIDKSFVDGLPDGTSSRHLVGSICRLADELSISVVAEGIERQEQAECLRDLGCPLGQGFLFSRPVDASTTTLLLDHGPVRHGRPA